MIRRGIGVQSFVAAGGAGTDADAQAFITAAAITNATQQSAINTLVTSLKTYGVWTKMKAIYPFVGGTASAHKFNLKDPRDLDAAFRLVFSGGGTHASTGWTPNGVNGYANTYFQPNILGQNSAHISVYSRTEFNGAVEFGCTTSSSGGNDFQIVSRFSNVNYSLINASSPVGFAQTLSTGLCLVNRISSSTVSYFRNNSKTDITKTSISPNTLNLYLGARNNNLTAELFSPRECAFASIGDGLTDTEAANFYTAVQAYQTTLGRSVGTQSVSDSDAQAFVNAAVIEDQIEATAINTLVTDLKSYGIWTKMKAIYPFCGGTASAHKWNLKDPRDLDAAFRLVFSGGWTHSSNGALPNGTNGYANTYFQANTLSSSSAHVSFYSRTDTAAGDKCEIGANMPIGTFNNFELGMLIKHTSNLAYPIVGYALYPSVANTNSQGFYISRRNDSTNVILDKNGSKILTGAQTASLPPHKVYIGAVNRGDTSITRYTDRQCAFASIGDGLTDTEASNLYTAVQAYQTSLSRNV